MSPPDSLGVNPYTKAPLHYYSDEINVDVPDKGTTMATKPMKWLLTNTSPVQPANDSGRWLGLSTREWTIGGVGLVIGGVIMGVIARKGLFRAKFHELPQSHPLYYKAHKFIHGWCADLAFCKPEVIIKRYDKNAVLQPTFWPRTLRGREEIVPYFQELMTRKDLKADVVKMHVYQRGHDCIGIIGDYNFYSTSDSKTFVKEARYIFNCRVLPNGKLSIVTHTSNSLPEHVV